MKYFLIGCTYDYYCQGYETTQGSFLVKAKTFEQACEKLKLDLIDKEGYESNAHEFKNLTIE